MSPRRLIQPGEEPLLAELVPKSTLWSRLPLRVKLPQQWWKPSRSWALPASVATAAVVLAETLPPAAVGVIFLGDRTRPGMGGIAIAGFVLAVCCAVALARFGEAHHDDNRTGPDGEPMTQMSGQAHA